MSVRILQGDCRDVMKTLADSSVDSIVTDPPYELGFMGKSWDSTGIAISVEMWKEAMRVLKPGGHLLAFSASRTYHRMACAIEDAGFEIRDQIMWLYSQGFPKSLNISKAIYKSAGAVREVVGINPNSRPNMIHVDAAVLSPRVDAPITAPATDAARQWDGWGTALKPAHEPIVMARKPLAKGCTVAANVLAHGTGAINVDGCRIEGALDGDPNRSAKTDGGSFASLAKHAPVVRAGGRWPANICHDGSDEVLAGFPVTTSGTIAPHHQRHTQGGNGNTMGAMDGFLGASFGDTGSAARFFYCAKSSKADRGEGNNHPTVKPSALMRYLCRLVTPPGGTILDPFAGSGSTGRAADIEGFNAILIELDPEYAAIASKRINGDSPLFANVVAA